MFGKIKAFFKDEEKLEVTLLQDKTGQPTSADLHIATAVLLVEMAAADKEIAPAEADALCRAMQKEFGILENDIPNIVQSAMSARKDSQKIDQFVTVINKNFSTEQRQILLTMVWQMIMADKKLEKLEERLATQLQFRLQLTADEAIAARKKAELEHPR